MTSESKWRVQMLRNEETGRMDIRVVLGNTAEWLDPLDAHKFSSALRACAQVALDAPSEFIESIQRGLDDVAAGRLVDLGSFVEYANDDDKEGE